LKFVQYRLEIKKDPSHKYSAGARGIGGAAKRSVFGASDGDRLVLFHDGVDADRDPPHRDKKHRDIHERLDFGLDRRGQYEKHADKQQDEDNDYSQFSLPRLIF